MLLYKRGLFRVIKGWDLGGLGLWILKFSVFWLIFRKYVHPKIVEFLWFWVLARKKIKGVSHTLNKRQGRV